MPLFGQARTLSLGGLLLSPRGRDRAASPKKEAVSAGPHSGCSRRDVSPRPCQANVVLRPWEIVVTLWADQRCASEGGFSLGGPLVLQRGGGNCPNPRQSNPLLCNPGAPCRTRPFFNMRSPMPSMTPGGGYGPRKGGQLRLQQEFDGARIVNLVVARQLCPPYVAAPVDRPLISASSTHLACTSCAGSLACPRGLCHSSPSLPLLSGVRHSFGGRPRLRSPSAMGLEICLVPPTLPTPKRTRRLPDAETSR